MKKLIILAAVASALCALKPLETKTYKVDSSKSELEWTGKKVTGEHKGLIPIANGELLIEENKLKGGKFELNVAGLTVTDIADKDANARLVGHLKNDDFFATDKFPKANFKITNVVLNEDKTYTVTGELTIKGITKVISFPATVTSDAKSVTATGLITVNRTLFDIKFKSASFFENLGDKAIYDDFTLNVKLSASISK